MNEEERMDDPEVQLDEEESTFTCPNCGSIFQLLETATEEEDDSDTIDETDSDPDRFPED